MIPNLCSSFWPLTLLYGLIGIAILCVIYCLIMLLYGVLRQKFAKHGSSIGAELITLSGVAFVGLLVNFFVLLFYSNEQNPSFAMLFRALYQAIGSFVFEGLSIDFNGVALSTAQSCFLSFFFYGWPLLLGVVFASIITAKANYEWFSTISIRLLTHKNRNIYIFTALNDETLQIAESLNEGNNMIIFCGPNLPAFDKKDELCRKLVKNGFYYCSYKDDKALKTPIVKSLGLRVFSHRAEQTEVCRGTNRIIVFSFDSENKIPKEEQNFSLVFDDADNLLSYIEDLNQKRYHNDKIKTKNHAKEGIFWIPDPKCLKHNDPYLCFLPLNENEKAEILKSEGTPEGTNFDFAEKWKRLGADLVKDKKFNEYPHGKVEIQDKIARVYLPVSLNTERIRKYLIKQYELVDPQIRKTVFVPDEKTTIEYYILSKREKNYQAYQGRITELKKKYEYGKGETFPVAITVWGEANAVADIVAKSIHDVTRDREWDKALCGEKVRVWSLGFGANAQAIVKNLYIHTTRMFEGKKENNLYKYTPNRFVAEAFAPDAETMGAFLSYENPFAIYLRGTKDTACGVNPRDPSELENDYHSQLKTLKDTFQQSTLEMLKSVEDKAWAGKYMQNGAIIGTRWCDNELSPLVAYVYKESCVDYDFLKKLDAVTGRAEAKERPQFIVIATGDDYQNIRLTNALVYDILRETDPIDNETPSKQMLIVNLRDQKNADLLNSMYIAKHSTVIGDGYANIKVNENLMISVVGTNEYLYSKDIIDYSATAKYSYNYGIAQKVTGNIPKLIETFYEKNAVGDPNDWEAAFRDVNNAIAAHYAAPEKANGIILKNWREMGQWDKESNQSAQLFMPVFRNAQEEIAKTPQVAIKYMLTEHQRWMRLHFVNGWIPGPRDKDRKIHNCLVPYNILEPFTYIFDMLNVFWDGGKK